VQTLTQNPWTVPVLGSTPLWRQCAAHFETLLRTGVLKPGQTLPPHAELATATGVGASTLQKALTWLVAEGILVRHRRRGTVVAQNAGRREDAWVAIMTRAMFDPGLSQWDLLAARAVVDTLADRKARFRFYHNAYSSAGPHALRQDIDPHLVEDVQAGRVKGVLVIGTIPVSHPEFRERLDRARIPVVETTTHGSLTPYVVDFDRPAFVRAAVRLAAARGCRRLALIETPGYEVGGRDPLAETFVAEAGRKGLTAPPEWRFRIEWPPSVAKGAAAFEALWQTAGTRPDGVVITDEFVALGVAQAAVAQGVAVPDTLRLVASVTAGADIAYPLPLDTIEFDAVQLIDHAWTMLKARMDGRVVRQRQISIGPRLEKSKGDHASAEPGRERATHRRISRRLRCGSGNMAGRPGPT
jgi:DNA-binding LacI/PurR family transcriptional regulator/DNA-binding transcriptional regulator YhcF (GntR family)